MNREQAERLGKVVGTIERALDDHPTEEVDEAVEGVVSGYITVTSENGEQEDEEEETPQPQPPTEEPSSQKEAVQLAVAHARRWVSAEEAMTLISKEYPKLKLSRKQVRRRLNESHRSGQLKRREGKEGTEYRVA